MYGIGQNPETSSKGPHASTSFPRHEEARPFPSMAPSPPPPARPSSTSPTFSRDASGERDANGNFDNQYSNEQSPSGASGVHPGEGGIFNFNSNENGGAVRLTHMTPISPTNEDVYSSEQLQRNPQPPISNSFLQVLSPSRPGGSFPYLFSGGPPIFSMHENEKYRKLMLKKQKRHSKKEKNVLNVFKAEEVEGHKGVEDIDSVLQSMGEKVEEKKSKVKKPKEKAEKTKSEKRERSRRSVEKDLEAQEEEEKSEDEDKLGEHETKLMNNKVRNKFVDDDLKAFKDNFYLVTPEPGPLTRHKSRDCLAGSVESLPTGSPNMSFTKVTSKKHRTKRSKEESGKPPPSSAAAPDTKKGGYALRSREAASTNTGREQTSSPTESLKRVEQNPPSSKPTAEIPSLEEKDFPKLVQDDFPALPGGVASDPAPVLASAWSRAVAKTSETEEVVDRIVAKNSDNEEITDNGIISDSNNVENEDQEKESNAFEAKASDCEAVIVSTVPSDSVCIDIEGVDDSEDIDIGEEVKETDIGYEEEVTKTDIYADLTAIPNNNEEVPENDDETVKAKIDNIEVVTSEDEFNRRKADNSAPVVIFSENDQDWTSAEFTFGFDINEDLVANSSNLLAMQEPTQQPQQMWSMQPPHTPIGNLDPAILSFGGPETMRMIVPVAVGVPVPVSGLGEHLPPLPFYPHQVHNGFIPPFRGYGMSFGHQMAPQQGVLHQYHEDELELAKEGVDDAAGEDHTISPESGISSASPLSWQPDSSPSLPAPGSYPHNRDAGRDNSAPLPLVSHVSQSLSNWQGHSVHSDSSESDRSSPAPGWATQVELEEDKEGTANATIESSDKTFDSGLSSENSNSLLEKDVIENKFNLGEIVNFISSSWSSVSQDSSVSVFSVSSPAHTDVTA